MDIPSQPARPSFVERSARSAVFVFLLLAIVTLAFGLGWGVKTLTADDSGSNGAATGSLATATGKDQVGAAILTEIYDLLKNNYVDKNAITPESFREAAINGVLQSLNDTHTAYLSPDDLKAGALDLNSTYQGIGASVSDKSGAVTIVAPFRDSPAEVAGIRAGDIILEVDGAKTDGWSDQQAVEKIRGVKGTTVVLKVKHTDGTIQTISVERGEIQIDSVFTEPRLEVIPGESKTRLVDSTGKDVTDIAYINISQFHEKTEEQLKPKLQELQGKPLKGLILDLRANPGGLLSTTVQVADEFLDSGTILSEKDSGGKETTWTAHAGGLFTKLPIVILMDQGSASGAEVLAGALHDNGRAKIVGTRSFGKGTVNQLQPLTKCGSTEQNGCGALYISVGRWYTPNGDQIEGVGVKPDVELPMTNDDYINKGDIQLFKAIDILRGNP
ncbi:MAG: S41 family peptidase [Dehalococcoidia bacterium]|nr:S41 family peptidase [Dehalococcoidia bacterium]